MEDIMNNKYLEIAKIHGLSAARVCQILKDEEVKEIVEMLVDGVAHARKQPEVERDTIADGGSIAQRMIGKQVIVRSYNEGINAGTVASADATGVELINCRRIWYMKPKDKKLSWYEGVAISGISDDSKVSGIVRRKTIIEDYSMTECSDDAFRTIMEATTNAQK